MKTNPLAKYILDSNNRTKLENNLKVWATFMESKKRIVAQTIIAKHFVSTVFLGLDHNYSQSGPPVLWETMVFGKRHGTVAHQARCTGQWEDALAMHNTAVEGISKQFQTSKKSTPVTGQGKHHAKRK